jgi:hypothetical protein
MQQVQTVGGAPIMCPHSRCESVIVGAAGEVDYTNAYAVAVNKCASGYPRLAAFVDSDPNFMIYRRFGYLRTRLLLYHQDVLWEKERDLDELDEETQGDPRTERQLCCRTRDENQTQPMRKELFEALGKEFQTYGTDRVPNALEYALTVEDDLLLSSAALYQLDEPVDRNHRSVAGLIRNDGQLAQPDRNYITNVDELVALGGDKEYKWSIFSLSGHSR